MPPLSQRDRSRSRDSSQEVRERSRSRDSTPELDDSGEGEKDEPESESDDSDDDSDRSCRPYDGGPTYRRTNAPPPGGRSRMPGKPFSARRVQTEVGPASSSTIPRPTARTTAVKSMARPPQTSSSRPVKEDVAKQEDTSEEESDESSSRDDEGHFRGACVILSLRGAEKRKTCSDACRLRQLSSSASTRWTSLEFQADVVALEDDYYLSMRSERRKLAAGASQFSFVRNEDDVRIFLWLERRHT
jgi:hypothetical protein